jgi:hypothetical protein
VMLDHVVLLAREPTLPPGAGPHEPLWHWPQVVSDGTLANLPTLRGTFVGRIAEVEPNEDARIRILGRRLGEAGI